MAIGSNWYSEMPDGIQLGLQGSISEYVLAAVPKKRSFFWLSAAWICGVRVDSEESNKCSVRVKLGFINKNPFKSLFWAVQGMAAEMPGGLLLQNKIKNSGQNIAMLLVGSSSKFTKKAVGKILFTFEIVLR